MSRARVPALCGLMAGWALWALAGERLGTGIAIAAGEPKAQVVGEKAPQQPPPPPSLMAAFDAATRTVSLSSEETGIILDHLSVNSGSAADSQPARQLSASREKSVLIIRAGNRPIWRVETKGLQAIITPEAEPGETASLAVTARWQLAPDAMPAILKGQEASDAKVVVTRLGPAQVPTAGGLFDRERDCALAAGPTGKVHWLRGPDGWNLSATASAKQPVTLTVLPHYYRDKLGIKFYAPFRKPSRWPTAPVLCMTWYGTHDQQLTNLKPHIDWAAEHLLPYAGPNFIFQLDDAYAHKDDRAMLAISDYIRSKGMLPGIWLAPFRVVPKNEEAGHADWFLHDKTAKTLNSFGGICYGGNAPTVNVNNAEAVEKWYAMWWKKANATWNFEFFKIDGQQDVVANYRASADGGGVEGYRKGVQIGRQIVGPEKFINACMGPIVDAIGMVDGSRTGGDTGDSPIAIHSILGSLYLNNVVWYSDPDAAANLYRSSLARARVNAITRALTGQQFLTDDIWTKVPPEVCRVWQQSFPSLDVYPVNLYGLGGDHDVFDLRIVRPWGTWDVVAVCNYGNLPTDKPLDLARLPLDAKEVHVFDYWNAQYLGRFTTDAKLPVALKAVDARLFALTPVAADDRPVLLSTNRHVSQGGLDLEQVDWKRDGRKWVAAGRSSHLVQGDPYELTFFLSRYQLVAVSSPHNKTAIRAAGRVARAVIEPAASGMAEWEAVFEAAGGALLELTPAMITLGLTPAEVTLANLGDQPARWTVAASDPRFRLSPSSSELAAGGKAAIGLSLDARDLELGSVVSGTLTVSLADRAVEQVRVTGQMPLPENLARKAIATASSSWHAHSGPKQANDGDPETYWSGGPSSEGWWLAESRGTGSHPSEQ